MHPFQKELQAVIDKLQEAIMLADALPPDAAVVRNRIKNSLVIEQNVINNMLGNMLAGGNQTESGPATSILGEPVVYRQPIKPEDIKPTNMEADKFIADRDNLYAVFSTLTLDQVSSKVGKPGGETVIRAVAKKAGYGDYKDGKINRIYVDAVKKLIKDKADAEQAIADAENSLQ